MFHNLTPVDPKWPLTSTKNNMLLVLSVVHSYIPNMRSAQASMLEISCLQGFHNLTPVDPKWPLTCTKNNRLLVLNVVHLHTTYEICPSFHAWDIMFTRLLQCFTIWPLLTPNDLWPPPKTIGFLYSMWYTYIPNMRSVQASHVEISCLQGFHNLTPVDLKWPLTSTKNNRLLVLIVVHLQTKYEICPCLSFPSWDIVFTSRSVQASLLEISCLQCFHNLTPVDLKWPLTSTKNNRLLVLIVVHLHTKYEICPSFPSWDIVFTSRRHDTHTYIHTHAIMNTKVTIIIETKKYKRYQVLKKITFNMRYHRLL